ncbi:MAG TPA: di-heme oxidoredictase family protein [Kofleriaceae bacterium]|nr:di-heme oxidoredictase family protein [Kofleriaceae bacterium]
MAAMAGCAISNGGDDQTAEQQIASFGKIVKSDAPGGAIPVTLKPGVFDPGPRGGTPAAGKPLRGLDKNQLALFNEGRFRIREVLATCESCANVTIGTELPPGGDALGDANATGAGARFNGISCGIGCHSQPDIGGSSAPVNPSFVAAHFRGAVNQVPFFETVDGPSREARFLFHPDGTRDGAVRPKFTVKGRSDAPDCVDIAQPDFAANQDNLALRIPSPVFGAGLIEAVQDKEILASHDATAPERGRLGIRGVANVGPLGTISRFGWKAQSTSIADFANQESAVEIGRTTDFAALPQTESAQCDLSPRPADTLHTNNGTPTDPTDNFNEPTKMIPAWQTFMMFMRLLDQPRPATLGASALRGQALFAEIGCASCHTPTLHTAAGETGSSTVQLRDVNVNLYSDLLLHDMGARLADNVIQGNAGPDMFRSAPLWGVGQRLFFLHDGRARTLDDAILQHYAEPTAADGRTPAYPASEANQVILNFGDLDRQGQQDILNFLRRL